MADVTMNHSITERISTTHGSTADFVEVDEFFGPGLLMTRLLVPRGLRRQGYGNKLLKRVCIAADASETIIYVQPSPYPDSPLQFAELVAWYERHGFKRAPNGLWVRLHATHPEKR